MKRTIIGLGIVAGLFTIAYSIFRSSKDELEVQLWRNRICSRLRKKGY